MKRQNLLWSGLALAAGLLLFFTAAVPAQWLNRLQAVARAASRAPQTKADFDIRAGLQRTLNDPADAEITLPLAPPEAGARAQQRRSDLPYALRRARPSLQMKWSTLTQAPSRLWSYQESLSAPSTDDAETIARRFLNNNADLLRLDDDDVAALQVARRYQDAHNGLTHLWLQQQIDGIEVFQGELALHLAKSGEIVALSGEALPNVAALANARKPHLNAVAALRLAAADAEAELNDTAALKAQPDGAEQKQLFDRAIGFSRDVEARLVYFPLAHNQVRLAWHFTLWMQETSDVYLTLIDAEKGTVLFRYNLTCYDENPLKPHGQVFTKDAPLFSVPFTTSTPPLTPREDVPFRATPFAGADIFALNDPHYDWWAGRPANNLISNNTSTYLDRDATPNQPDLPRLEAADGNFSFALDLTQQPTEANYQRAAQTNLFYWINRYHDILYSYGFTEAAGNFQTDNFGRGGRGADAVLGDAQDGAGTNNANFSTPTDGAPGRVQMFLWTRTNPQRDGDFDQGVIIHELTHGLSNRLVGNATGLGGNQSGGMGEGWSDYFGLVLLRSEADDLNGNYAVGQYVINNFQFGIRRFPYSTSTAVYPYTYKDLRLSTQVHAVGEIWCNALLEMRALLIQRLGYKEGQRQSIQLVVDGLKLTPRAPSFLDARDAILLADRVNNAGANQCLLWQAFAKRGMGFGAFTSDASDGVPDESLFNAPYCVTLGSLRTDKPNYISGETLKLNLGDSNAAGALTAVITTTVTGDREVLTLSADRNIRGSFDGQLKVGAGRARAGDGIVQGSVEAGDEIVITYNDTNTGAGAAAVRVSVPIAREKVSFDDNVENGNAGWVPSGAWAIVNTRGASPLRSWTDSPAGNYANNADLSLVSPLFDFTGLSNVTLSFAQSLDIQEGFDFGAVEVSTDDGQTWRRIGASSGVQPNFRQAQVRLRGLDNQARARIRLRFISDVAVVGDGWYVDDLRITGRSVSPAIIPPGTSLDPALASVAPAFGPPAGGTRVTISGANFTESEDTSVTFDGVPATGITLVSNGILTALAPPHAAGAVNVRISNRNGALSLANGYTYFSTGGAAVQPEIMGLYPDFGSLRGGTVVTILGKNLTPETRVNFDTRAAAVTFVNSTTLRAISPAAATAGRADVLVLAGALSHNRFGGFNYINPTPPSVDVLTPDGGEAVFVGSIVSVRWNSSDNQALAKHRLSLFRPGTLGLQFVSDIAADLPGSARIFNWTIPTTVANGEYRLRVTATDNEGAETEAYSTSGFTVGRRWETPGLSPIFVYRNALVTDGRYLYTIGGNIPGTVTSAVQRIDPQPATPLVTNMAPLPSEMTFTRAVYLRGKIHVSNAVQLVGGALTDQLVYDIATNVWSRKTGPGIIGNTAVVADEARGIYYLTGGGAGTASASTAFKSYDPATDRWTDLPAMANFRDGHAAALIGGKLYVAGGQAQTGGLRSAEVYDFDTRQWSPLSTLSRNRAFATSAVGTDAAGNPYWVLIGGFDVETGINLGAEVFDVRRNRWLVLDNSFAQPIFARSYMGGATLGNFLYGVGGANVNGNALTIVRNIDRLNLASFALSVFDQAPPVLAAPETVVAVANTEVRFNVNAEDQGSGIPLTIAAAGLPPGAEFSTLVSTNNSTRGSFRWTPAASDAGRTFTLTFTASDGQLSDTRTVNLRVVTARPLAAVNAADFRSGALAPESIASIFGTELAVRAGVAVDLPLPYELEGTTVTVNGLRAPLFFVSPAQLNFAVPASLSPGPATIIVSTAAGSYSAGTVQIAPSVPALFTRDQTGRGEAFAQATDGVRFQTPPFDVVVNGRPNVLVLYGTGFRRALAANPSDDGVAEAVTATIDGWPARVLFAGAQGGFVGLDQINVEFPAGLAGSGRRYVDVVLSVNGANTNRVLIEIR